MSEMLNPHVVKESEGEAYTIQRFVTGKPLADEDMLPDEHGVYPVSPLGFLMSDNGVPLTSAPPTEMVVTYPIYDESDPEHPVPITPEEVEKRGGNWSATRDALIAQAYLTKGKYDFFYGDTACYRVISLRREADTLIVVVDGEIVESENETLEFFFINATSDDYTLTGLLNTESRVIFETEQVDNDGDRTMVYLAVGTNDVAFGGNKAVVGEGKLLLGVIAYSSVTGERKKYIVVDPSNGDSVSGFYMFGENRYAPYRRVFTYDTMFPPEQSGDTHACHSRNGYSNGEVADWVESHAAPLIRYGLHPYSEAGELERAGAFVRWFASCGNVDISGGGGTNPVIVPGFGLGAGYVGECPAASLVSPGGNTDSGTVHKELVFGYATKHDAVQPVTGTPALPRDWPFSDFSAYSGVERDNNITLVRHGVTYNGIKYGSLERESIECDACQGTGEVDGHECSACNGTGHVGTTRVVMDRMHVCLYNDFTPSDASHGHVAGTTVLKKTFINLATPINTNDGEEFNVTVSLPNVGLDSAFSGSDVLKNLNGYYAFVSQPRVYVVSGTWKFSDTKVNFTIDNGMAELTLDRPLEDRTGTVLRGGTAVRMKLSFGCYPGKRFSVTGTFGGTTVVLDEPIDDTGLAKALAREAMRDTPRPNSACGAAYVEPNNGTLPAGIENLGLNAVRNEHGALGTDNTGDDGKYNKVYNSRGEHDRPGVLYESDGTARVDQRQIVATVYPTVTNTFPWAITGRRKLNVLDRLMTMDADAGVRGMYARIFEMNQRIVHRFIASASFTPEIYPMDITVNTARIPVELPADGDLCSFVAAVLNVGEGGERPVAQARRAVAMMAEDYRNARAKRGDVGSLSTLNILTSDTRLEDEWDFGTMVAADAGITNEYENVARRIRLRHLPPILTTAGTSPSGLPDSPYIRCFPYVDSDFEFYSSNPYGFGLYDSAAMTEEVPCEIVDRHDARVFSMNSVVDACLKSGFQWLEFPSEIDDLKRMAELEAVDLQNEADLLKPHGERGSGCGWMEAIDAFTKIVSPDNIPVPSLDDGYDYSDIGGNTYLTAGDAYGRYRLENPDEVTGERFISTDMPVDDALGVFLKDYIPSYAAKLPKRNWDSWRVVLPADVGTGNYDDEPVYQTRVKWNPLVCDRDPVSRGKYAADGIFVGSGFDDPNMNRVEIGDGVNVDVSTPPYTCPAGYSESEPFSTAGDMHAVGYVRVSMKFTFSADAGRWYCTDYRQAPVSYLSPLYGAKALEERLPETGARIWTRTPCGFSSWKETSRHLYSESQPLEINPSVVESVMGMDLSGRRLVTPYNPVVSAGGGKTGLGLSAPVNRFGDRAEGNGQDGVPHANFWSVYEHIRPAVGVVPGSDIPKYCMGGDGSKHYYHSGGIMSDAVLWGQYDYPEKRKVAYHLPDTRNPDEDLGKQRLVYAARNPETGMIETGDISVGRAGRSVLAFSDGNES